MNPEKTEAEFSRLLAELFPLEKTVILLEKFNGDKTIRASLNSEKVSIWIKHPRVASVEYAGCGLGCECGRKCGTFPLKPGWFSHFWEVFDRLFPHVSKSANEVNLNRPFLIHSNYLFDCIVQHTPFREQHKQHIAKTIDDFVTCPDDLSSLQSQLEHQRQAEQEFSDLLGDIFPLEKTIDFEEIHSVTRVIKFYNVDKPTHFLRFLDINGTSKWTSRFNFATWTGTVNPKCDFRKPRCSCGDDCGEFELKEGWTDRFWALFSQIFHEQWGRRDTSKESIISLGPRSFSINPNPPKTHLRDWRPKRDYDLERDMIVRYTILCKDVANIIKDFIATPEDLVKNI